MSASTSKREGAGHVAWRKSRTVTARLDALKLLWTLSIWCDIGK